MLAGQFEQFFSPFFSAEKKQGEEELISVFWLQHYGNERKEVKYSNVLFVYKQNDRPPTRLVQKLFKGGEVVHHF